MKKLVQLLFLVFIVSCSSDNNNDNIIIYPEKIYEGSAFLTSQAQVNEFGSHNYTHITGYVIIFQAYGTNENYPINDLSPLQSIRHIGKELDIKSNPELSSLQGLNSLESVGKELTIYQNPELLNLQGLNSLESVGRLMIYQNPDLRSLSGLDNLTQITGNGTFVSETYSLIRNNPKLRDLCPIRTAVSNSPDIQFIIDANLFNPTTTDIIQGNCSM